jgi:hypothetical protein
LCWSLFGNEAIAASWLYSDASAVDELSPREFEILRMPARREIDGRNCIRLHPQPDVVGLRLYGVPFNGGPSRLPAYEPSLKVP